jgi:hypothetical protein
MKIRNGFVSNSSSSSFVIFTQGVCDYNSDGEVYALGSSLNEGQDFFRITKEIKEFIDSFPEELKREILDRLTCYKVYKQIDEDYEDTVDKDSLPKNFIVKSFQKDHYCSDTLEIFVDNYIDENISKKILKNKLFPNKGSK